ncbi:MAG: hypothetical protein KJO07_03490 [Deltaproteobacteria bacterium]|nr:hypothetical protein [Deltaproteobacteria bacterium]
MSKRPEFAPVTVRYAETPAVAGTERMELVMPTDGCRSGAAGVLALEDTALVRDALLTMGEILASDHRFKASDRSDYLAYLLKQGKRASKELWEAQKKYLERRFAEEVDAEAPLDPLVTLTDEQLAIEVFSADESAYARLTLDAGKAFTASDTATGTTHIDLAAAIAGLSQLRSYRPATIELRPSEGGDERTIKVPYRWVRALGQMQAAATLPATRFELAPIDLYNVLFTLRTQRAKTSPRALRYELVPGQPPRIVLEPWDLVLEATSGDYEGNRPGVVRTWGRRRLSFLARILPHIKSAQVHLVGAGLPAYYVFDLGIGSLTVALSGWTDSGWAGIATFDLFGGEVDAGLASRAKAAIAAPGKTLAELQGDLSGDESAVRNAVLKTMQSGDVVYELASGRFVHRPLFDQPLDPEHLRYRDEREEAAHRLLAVDDQVRLTTVHDLGGEGVRIEGEVEDKVAHRSYQTSFTIDREGRTVDASCSSPQFRRSGLREGPTVPMIALRLLYARQKAELEQARNTEEGRKLIRAETRMLIKRDRGGATMMRVSLNDRKVVVRWGPHPEQMRMSQQHFDSPDDARQEYFGRLARCAEQGFIDASQAESV